MKTLYLHIGMSKTGTKSIQNFCWENNKILNKYGYCYPDLSRLCPETIKVKNARFMIQKIKVENDDKEALAKAVAAKYREGMDLVVKAFETYDNVILSDEDIFQTTFNRRKSLWQELKDDGEKYGFTVKIIVYLRRQDEFMASRWNQDIKDVKPDKRITMTWEEYISDIPKSRQMNYFQKLESMAEYFGKENIVARRFQRGAFYQDSIYADFIQIIGLEMTDEYHISKEERNLNLPGNTHEFKRILNGVNDLSDDDLKFMRGILEKCAGPSKEAYPCAMLSKDESKKIISKYKKSNRRVAKEYLGESFSDLFDTNITDLPKWTENNPFMQQDMIRFMAIGLKKLRDENKKLRADMKKLQQKVDKMAEKPVKKETSEKTEKPEKTIKNENNENNKKTKKSGKSEKSEKPDKKE